MPFLVKDLLITVVGGPGAAEASDHCTGSCCLNPCSLPSCDNASCIVTPITGSFGEEVINPADLAALKEQLLLAVKSVEERQAAAEKRLAPQTLEEAELAEKQLRAALTEVRAIKKSLGG
jgi:hypothetical protein